MRYAQLVIGPAGSGKSTYCATLANHGQATGRAISVVNLDPAAEHFNYDCLLDVRQLVSVDDVMSDADLRLGPNGSLVFAMEYLSENFDWLEEQLGEPVDDYLLFDCPGQVELFTHNPVMRKLAQLLVRLNFHVCAVFLLDAAFLLDVNKFLSGSLVALSCMVSLEVAAVNVLTKMDLLSKKNRDLVESFIETDVTALLGQDDDAASQWQSRHRALTEAIGRVVRHSLARPADAPPLQIDDYSLVKYQPLNIQDEESIAEVLLAVDMTLQYGEDEEVRDRYPEEMDSPENGRIP